MEYNLSDIKSLLGGSFEKNLTNKIYALKRINANELLTHTRFDIAFKLLYLEMKDKGVEFSREVYTEHIRAFSLGNFIEPGNKEKNSIKRFFEEFDNIFESIKINGFDGGRTLIPLSKNGSIANGAHRVASAIYLNETVDCVEIDVANYICDYQFFYHRGVPEPILDIGATKFVEYANNMYIAFIWPTARGHEKELKEIIPNIVYEKKVILNANGAHNLLSQIYAGEKWLGNAGNNFSGVHTKLAACFETFDAIKVVAFQADNLEIVLKIKDETRALFNKGKHSIHITDTGSEAVKIAHLVLNNNSVHFLNYAKPNKYSSIYRKIAKYKSFIEKNNLSVDNMLLDGGTVLTLYGLRESSDIDYFSSESMRAKYYDDALDQHDEELIHHKKEKLELIYNPKFYFYFNGLKFISFYQLYQMKKNRSNIKDINDCKMMEALIENNWLEGFVSKTKQSLYYAIIRFSMKILKVTGMYKTVRYFYRKIKQH